MFLKKVEIQGFKTFADNTRLEFPGEKGITAIVGPNGCGKSNLLDAIRWVTGEQSIKLLRGTSHEEIIFAGSQEKKPLSLAEVTLTIDNSSGKLPIDYTEVMIKRRLYRSGESEYYINKENCRLKDIHNLLMDTGMGKGTYSLISQGQVAEVLHSKPEDRRTIFEEAAGINKYKNRKIAAQRKLLNTEQNLLRLQDIRSEIHQQMGPLEEQAKKAEEYKTLKTELGGLEIGLCKEQVDRLLQEKQKVLNTIDDLQAKLQEADQQVAEIDEKKRSFREKTAELEKQNLEKRSQIESLRREKEELSSNLKVNQERLDNQYQRLQQLAEEKEKVRLALEVLQGKKIEVEIEEKAGQEHYQKVEQELGQKNLEAEGIIQRWKLLAQEKEDIQMTLFDMESEVMSVRNQLIDLQSKERFTSEELRRNEVSIKKLQEEKMQLEENQKEVIERRQQLQQKLAELNDSKHTLEDEYARAEEELKKNENTYVSLKERLDTKTSRLELLKEMQKNYEGFFEGVRNFLGQRDPQEFSGIYDVIADIIKPQKGYDVALEVALGNRLQDIIVDNSNTAEKAIEFLKENNLGRATFIPLDKVIGFKVNVPNNAKSAVDLVEYDQKYSEVVNYLLGRILIVESRQEALRIQKDLKKNKEVIRIVTVNGEMLTPQGAITGGAIKHQTTLLGRQREIIELGNILETLRVQLEEIKQEKGQIEEKLKELQIKQEEVSANIQHQEIEDKTLLNDKTRMDIELQKKTDELLAVENSYLVQKEDFANLKKRQQEIEDELGRHTSHKENMTENMSAKELEIRTAEEDKERASQVLTELRVAAASVKAQYEQVKIKINTVLENIAIQEKQQQEKHAEEEALLQKKAETEQAIVAAKEKLPFFEEQENALVIAMEEQRLEKERIFNDLEVIERRSKEANELDKEWRSKVGQEEVQLARLDAELNAIEQRLSAEYELTLDDVVKTEANIDDFEKVKQRVERLKKTLKRMEPVNLLAIDEFRAQKERLTFIEGQCKDLDEAKKNLHTLIKELDGLAIKNFEETFQTVKKYFEETFSKLFEGGVAEIRLLDEQNLLETGIEIYAQPPGKKRQNLTLLSGGEKALTAIALLFALLKTRPSPFCIMDEVDAALDEANIGRFNKILREFSKESQIMVITHSKRTMSIAGSMYGVTMEKNGISRLVSMKLVK
ncbi:chromosome segregation protein SMC [Candidatus Margulisiibacteriota bacterium]